MEKAIGLAELKQNRLGLMSFIAWWSLTVIVIVSVIVFKTI